MIALFLTRYIKATWLFGNKRRALDINRRFHSTNSGCWCVFDIRGRRGLGKSWFPVKCRSFFGGWGNEVWFTMFFLSFLGWCQTKDGLGGPDAKLSLKTTGLKEQSHTAGFLQPHKTPQHGSCDLCTWSKREKMDERTLWTVYSKYHRGWVSANGFFQRLCVCECVTVTRVWEVQEEKQSGSQSHRANTKFIF